MSATKQPMLSSTHAIFLGLQRHLKKVLAELPESAPPELRQGLTEAHRKLSDYFTKFDKSRYYSWATRMNIFLLFESALIDVLIVLDPRLSYAGLKTDYADNPELLRDLYRSKDDLQTHFDTLYTSKTSRNSDNVDQTTPGSPQKFDFTSHYSRGSASTENELAEYFRLTAVPKPWSVDPLQWWYSRWHQFPNLYLLVRNILCIPGTH
jgi:hypothetical protein